MTSYPPYAPPKNKKYRLRKEQQRLTPRFPVCHMVLQHVVSQDKQVGLEYCRKQLNSWHMLKSLKMVYAKFQFQIVFDGKTNDSEIKLYCINLYNILSLPWGRTFGLRSTLDATWFVANWDHPNRSRGQRSQAQQKASEKVMRYAGLKRGARLVNWYQCHVFT